MSEASPWLSGEALSIPGLFIRRVNEKEESTLNRLGYPSQSVLWIGVIELVCVVLYLVPRTAILGGLLLTGYLGGAVASQLRIGAPLLSHTLFPIYVNALMWGGLYVRDTRLGDVLPFRR